MIGKYSGLSRPTVVRYLEALELTNAITVLRPFSKNSTQSIVSQPKVYAFDTGFSAFAKGLHELRHEDLGLYLENLTLESLQALGLSRPIQYWRTKQGREIDFIFQSGNKTVHTIECKWKADNYSPENLKAFRADNPNGLNWVVCADKSPKPTRSYGNLSVTFIPIKKLRSHAASIPHFAVEGNRKSMTLVSGVS